jgi:hypothetical protein
MRNYYEIGDRVLINFTFWNKESIVDAKATVIEYPAGNVWDYIVRFDEPQRYGDYCCVGKVHMQPIEGTQPVRPD